MADKEPMKRYIRFFLKYLRCIQSFERQEIVPKQIMLQRLKLCQIPAEQEEHEFLQDLLRETSLEIYVNNSGGYQPLEC